MQRIRQEKNVLDILRSSECVEIFSSPEKSEHPTLTNRSRLHASSETSTSLYVVPCKGRGQGSPTLIPPPRRRGLGGGDQNQPYEIDRQACHSHDNVVPVDM